MILSRIKSYVLDKYRASRNTHRCYIKGHNVTDKIVGPYLGIGDGFDLFGKCNCCKKVCWADSLYGDGKWRILKL